MSVRPDGPRLRRTWPQRLLITFNVFAIFVALSGAGAIVYAKRTAGQIHRITDIGKELQPADELPPGEPQNFLIVGVDSDEGLAIDDPVRSGRDKGPDAAYGLRSDTIMVVRIDPAKTEVRMLSFPRDLLVKIPGEGRARINAAVSYGEGGPGLLIQTIKANFDIDINHYVQVDFAGFKSLVRQIGGVPVWFSTPVRDKHSGLLVENAGCTTLDENGSLAYARSRYFQYQDENGRWRSDGASDYGRISRQQDFIRRVIHRAVDQGARNVAKLVSMIGIGVQNITLDEFTKPADLITLGKAFRSFDPDRLKTYSLPVEEVRRGGADVLELIDGEAEPILALFRGTGAEGVGAEVEPQNVTVRVINGTGTANQAAEATDGFAAAGFQVASPNSQADVWRTEVRYRPGEEAQALLVARYLGADPTLVPDPDVTEITVVTGPDFLAVRDSPRPATEITTTTSSTTTSTTTTTTVSGGTGPGSTSSSSTTVPADGVPVADPQGYVPGAPPAGISCG